jgi:hypothetical protein
MDENRGHLLADRALVKVLPFPRRQQAITGSEVENAFVSDMVVGVGSRLGVQLGRPSHSLYCHSEHYKECRKTSPRHNGDIGGEAGILYSPSQKIS